MSVLNRMTFFKKHWISLIYCLTILIACTISLKEMPAAPVSNFDKIVHCLMFFFLGGCIYFENSNYFKTPISYQRIVLGTFLFPIVYGGFIELVQNYLSPYRTGDWNDFLWNSVGAFFAFALALRINKR